jgi:hypothetical protein
MIFLSYSHSDRQIVAPIAEAFRKVFGQNNVFFDQWAIQPGDSIIGKMDEGLSQCQYFFFFISRSSLNSKMVKLEWRNALVKSINGDSQFIPVKIDDCLIPEILLQNLYINLYGNGLDFALRQMIEVASGKNTYRPGELVGFQNAKAYVSGTRQKMKIEFRAEVYTEPHSKWLIVCENIENDLSCISPNSNMFHVRFHKNISPCGRKNLNAFSISRSEATSPKFPFAVELTARAETPIKFVEARKAVSEEEFALIPSIFLNVEMDGSEIIL